METLKLLVETIG